MKNENISLGFKGTNLLFVLLLLVSSVLFSCDSKPTAETERAWQQSFRVSLIDGYSNFKAHFVDADAAVYIFSYDLPSQTKYENVFSILRKQTSDYAVVAESKNELVMKRLGKMDRFQAFDEYSFLLDEQHGKITVMFASIDSPVELKNHSIFVEKFQKIRPCKAFCVNDLSVYSAGILVSKMIVN